MAMADARASIGAFIAREARDGERWAAAIRLVVAGLAAARMLVMERSGLFVEPSLYVPFAGLLTVGVLFSAISLWFWEPEDTEGVQRKMLLSVIADAALMFWVALPRVIWPNHVYDGITHATEFLAYPVIIAGAGLRLSARTAAVGALLNLAAVATLIALDLAWYPWCGAEEASFPCINYQPAQTSLHFIIIAGAVALSINVAHRTLRLVTKAAQEERQAERTRQRLGAYVSEEIAGIVMQDGGDSLGGEYRDVAVLFSDLRGFTTYSEQLEPGQVVSELNAYLEAMVAEIRREGGVVDKYIGDAIMAVFGVPTLHKDEARRAIRAAWRMQQALDAHNEARAKKHLPPLAQGIGLHFGPVIAGNIGTADRMQFTVVGDTVNVASRLEGASKLLGCPIVLSQSLVTAAGTQIDGDPDFPQLRPLGTTEIRGRKGRQQVFTIADLLSERAVPGGEGPPEG